MAAAPPSACWQKPSPCQPQRHIDAGALPWQATRYPGSEIEVLLEDKESGLLTALFRWRPGAALPTREHGEIEQTFLLADRIADHEGERRRATRSGVPHTATTSGTRRTGRRS